MAINTTGTTTRGKDTMLVILRAMLGHPESLVVQPTICPAASRRPVLDRLSGMPPSLVVQPTICTAASRRPVLDRPSGMPPSLIVPIPSEKELDLIVDMANLSLTMTAVDAATKA